MGAEMLGDVQAPTMQTSGTTNTKTKTGNDELMLFDSLMGDWIGFLFRLNIIFFWKVNWGPGLRLLFFWR